MENLQTCADVIKKSNLDEIQTILGKRNGEVLWQFCHGCDPRPIPNPQAGVGDTDRTLTVSVNWGIRLTSERGVSNFMRQMAEECALRLREAEGTTEDITLKVRTFNFILLIRRRMKVLLNAHYLKSENQFLSDSL